MFIADSYVPSYIFCKGNYYYINNQTNICLKE